ncbi:MAG: DNA repair protein RadC [Bacteroides sp.]|nr:DNA repair protein RadC [Bacteroides sp.]
MIENGYLEDVVEAEESIPALTVKEFDPCDRPREKAERFGYHSLSTSELLALILRTGTHGCPITQICSNLLEANSNSLHLLMRRSVKEIQMTPGMGPVKAGQVKAIMELAKRYFEEESQTDSDRFIIRQSKDIYNLMRCKLSNENKEQIWILTLNRRNQVIGKYQITCGSSCASLFDLNAALKVAILDEANGLIMLHNHPSGNTQPSPQDDTITRSLKNGTAAIDVRLLDHLIITYKGYYSYSDEGRL